MTAARAEVKLTLRQMRRQSAATGLALTNAVRKTDNFWLAIRNGLASYWNMIVLFKDGILGMIRGTDRHLTGPVGLAQLTGEIVKTVLPIC